MEVSDQKAYSACTAGVDYAYGCHLPHWGRQHGPSPSSWSSGLGELHLFLVDVYVGSASALRPL
jgi:hypothetical protein